MKSRNPLRVRSVALAIACGVVAFGTQPVRGAAAQVPQTTTSVAKAAARVDGGWPRGYTAPSGAKIVLYQPQVSDWIDQKRLTAYAAVSYLKTGAAKPDLGVIQIQADSTVSVEERLVNFSKLAITESNFQTLSKTENQEIVSEIMKAYPEGDRVIALDRVLASIERSSLKVKDADNLKADPPRVYFSELPAILVGVDGEPVWSPIKDNDLKYAVNTNWDLFQFGTAKQLYLRNGDTWLKSLSLVGPWTPAGKLPDAFNTLPADDDWKDVKANLPGKTVTSAPVVYATTQPAELILLAGAPKYIHVEGTGLEWVSNTDSDVFRMGTTGTIYYLVSGRWFSAPNFSGPWTFATPNLPEDFKNIPRSHTRSYVRASVPGTDEAIDAVLLANVPTTARVNKKELQAPEVAYSGNPEYKAVEGTTVQRAVNTDKDIIKVGDVYYMCFEGVWFMATGPNGPWSVASSVPGQIYEIPASSPSYPVTYVTVEDDDESDDWVDFGYYAGYTGMMIGWGCCVWGSGWYYPPYVWYGGYYPAYYPYGRTYGSSAWYNPYTGRYGYSARAYGPYGGVAYGARYNSTTGTYSRGVAAWGPGGAGGVAAAYNPRTGTGAVTRQGSNVYGSWGSTAVQRGDDWAKTSRVTNSATGTTTRVTRTDEGGAITRRGSEGGFVGSNGDNIYAGKDGNVYKRGQDGSWSKYENGKWDQVERPQGRGENRPTTRPGDSMTAEGKPSTRDRDRPDTGTRDVDRSRIDPGQFDRGTRDQLERDRASRNMGASRTRDFSSYQRSPAPRSGSMNRSYGGGYGGGGRSMGGRGGGGRRR